MTTAGEEEHNTETRNLNSVQLVGVLLQRFIRNGNRNVLVIVLDVVEVVALVELQM